MAYIGQAPANKPVSGSDLDATVITGQTALSTAPADTDEFLISDAGVLKRIDYSLIKGGGTHVLLSTSKLEASSLCSSSSSSKSFFDFLSFLSSLSISLNLLRFIK